METLITGAVEGFYILFTWPNPLYVVAGTLIAMFFAFMPGVGGITLMAIAVPFTFNWEPIPTLLLFGAFVAGGTFTGSITAILFNVPGTAPNAATTLDGHPMARNGEAKTAIGCSASSSALGSTVGILALCLMIPLMRRLILAFGSAEFLMLVVWGLTSIAVVTRGSPLKGLAAAGMGLLLAFVGYDPAAAEPRYAFGTLYLRDGLDLLPVFLGIFAMAEMIHLMVSRTPSISGKLEASELSGNTWQGVCSAFTHWKLFLRASLTGTVIGSIPGIGGTVASFVAYGQAVQSSKNPENFGRGDIRGVLAPEAANDAKDAGSLLPVLAFGIPGSEGTVMLLVVMSVHGIAPGREMLTHHLPLAFALIWTVLLSNWITSLMGLALVNPLARLTVIRTRLMAPWILALSVLGAFASQGRIIDVGVAFGFGVFGYYMKKFGWPRIPLIIALVLGELFERNLHLVIRLHEAGRIHFLERPIVLVLIVLTLISLLLPYLQARRPRPIGRTKEQQT